MYTEWSNRCGERQERATRDSAINFIEDSPVSTKKKPIEEKLVTKDNEKVRIVV